MIKINNYLTTFLSIGALFSLILSVSVEKIFPILTKQTLTYCTQLTQSLTIPHIITRLPLLFFMLLIVISITKFIVILVKTYQATYQLEKKVTDRYLFRRTVGQINMQGKVRLIQSEKVFAFCFGLLKPKIYVSTAMVKLLSTAELKAVLLHEKYHVDNRDSLIMALVAVIKTIFPFFPVLSDLFTNYLTEREINADNYATKKMGESTYLINVMKKLLYIPQESFVFAPAIAELSTLETRINALLKRKTKYKHYKTSSILLSMLFGIIFSLVLLSPVQAVELHTSKQDIMLICTDMKQCSSACTSKAVFPGGLKASSVINKTASHPFSQR
jgi:beta-lactamase regulating signal transducer with metallopeptidase domain